MLLLHRINVPLGGLGRFQLGNLCVYMRKCTLKQRKVPLLVGLFHFSGDPAAFQQQPLFPLLPLDVRRLHRSLVLVVLPVLGRTYLFFN
jgi:hypothetical protein